MSITPSMNITLPEVSVTPGPDWATELNAAFEVVDEHDHTTGNGVQVPSAGLNINADVSMNQYKLSNSGGISFFNNVSVLGTSIHNTIYAKGGDLYWNNNSGSAVKITAGTTINVSGVGGIGGNYTDPGSTASVIYSLANKSYIFYQDTNNAGNLAAGNVSLYEPGVVSAKSVTIKSPPSLVNNIEVNMFGDIPTTPGKNYAVSLNNQSLLEYNRPVSMTGIDCVGNSVITGNETVSGTLKSNYRFKNSEQAFDSANNALILSTTDDAYLNANSTRYALTMRTVNGGASPVITLNGTGIWTYLFPPGAIVAWGGTTAPTGFHLCYGQAVSRTQYPDLFAAIGTIWGVGDGSTTFNLPDLRGRAPIGKDNMGGSAANRVTSGGSGIDGSTLNAAGGTQTHTMDPSEIASHTHGVGTLAVGAVGNHQHDLTLNDDQIGIAVGGTANPLVPGAGNPHTYTTTAAGGHTHNLTGSTDATGSTAPFSIMQPILIVNYIIRW